MNNYNEVVEEIKKRFPDFIIDEDIRELPTVVFGFLADYFIKIYDDNNRENIDKVTEFVNMIAESGEK